jgi:hypothetical protein
MKFALILISYLLILTGTNLAQTAIKGIVLDTELKTALAYVNIGIKILVPARSKMDHLLFPYQRKI